MNSIRLRLFAILLATTGAVWLFAVVWIYQSTQAEVEHVLDARLMEAARMVSSLVTDHHIDVEAAIDAATRKGSEGEFETAGDAYSRQLSCQIWSLQGALVSRSESAPTTSLSGHETGFADTDINGERWRVYAVVNPERGVRVLVGDSLEIRDRLVSDVVKGLLLPALVILPLLAALIWLSVERGLAPFNRIAASLSARGATDLHPLEEAPAPREIRPVIAALNKLFRRVGEARERERNFTAYAAHELKTPLAGLRTQAQIAIRSDDREVQRQALGHILTSVDRTSRMVRQLIDMAIVDSSNSAAVLEQADLGVLLEDLASELVGLAAAKDVRIEIDNAGRLPPVVTDRALLRLALRNVLENAVQHSPEGAMVSCRLTDEGRTIGIVIRDRGAGLDPEEFGRVTERFYRGSQGVASGSGLGLAIVQMAMRRLKGKLEFSNGIDGGLAVKISIAATSA